ncbi:MAG TPA: ABC transporter permease, partial [Streptosporangiaceae bacterium]|nr:ABC transporter permease [Streptosporangiaceae bacterium]
MTTTQAPPAAAEYTKAPSASEVAALIADAPVPRPTLIRTFNAMMAREFRVLRRNAISTFTRAVMQPLLFVFVFAWVFPKIGGGFSLGGAGAAGAAKAAAGPVNFATILVPGLMASMLLMQGIMAVTFPLVMEFSWQRTIEDRALAPVPIRVLAIQKIVAGAVQAFLGACIVFPIVLLVHAPGQAPHVHVTNWALFIFILVTASLLTSSLGLLLGTIMDPRKMQMLFAVILLPATMLGCVYYPSRHPHLHQPRPQLKIKFIFSERSVVQPSGPLRAAAAGIPRGGKVLLVLSPQLGAPVPGAQSGGPPPTRSARCMPRQAGMARRTHGSQEAAGQRRCCGLPREAHRSRGFCCPRAGTMPLPDGP